MKKSELKSLIRECINEVMLAENLSTYRGQILNLRKEKDAIIEAIDEAIKSKNYDVGTLAKAIYDVLRNASFGDELIIQKNFASREEKLRYQNVVTKKFPVGTESGNPWGQADINPKKYPKKSGKITYNYYITFEKTKENFLNLLDALEKNFQSLYSSLESISDNYQTPISFKIMDTMFFSFLDNDNLKFYYYDKDAKNDIEKVVKNWLNSNNIKISPRTHSHGFDTDKSSYGELLAKTIAKELMKLVEKYGSKFTPEQYYEWLTKHFLHMIQNVKHPDYV